MYNLGILINVYRLFLQFTFDATEILIPPFTRLTLPVTMPLLPPRNYCPHYPPSNYCPHPPYNSPTTPITPPHHNT